MTLDERSWYFLIRLVRRSAPPHGIVCMRLELVTDDCDVAFAECLHWRDDEPTDDCLVVRWSVLTGQSYVASNCQRPLAKGETIVTAHNRGMLAKAELHGVILALSAMNGEYGESLTWEIRPNLDAMEGSNGG